MRVVPSLLSELKLPITDIAARQPESRREEAMNKEKEGRRSERIKKEGGVREECLSSGL